MKDKILAIDIGGSFIKSALYSDGKLGEVRETPTPLDSYDSLKKALLAIVGSYQGLIGIGISMPGFIDTEEGIARTGGYLDYIKEIKIVEDIAELTGLKVTVENDAKAAMTAELRAGSLKGVQNAVMLVFGTGLGGAIAVDGKILRGTNLMAGEFSYIGADYHHPLTMKDSLGHLCGRYGLSECVERRTGLKELSGREIFKKIIQEDDKEVYEGLRDFCRNVVFFIYNLSVITDPELFTIGGGISQQPLFIKTLREEIEEYAKKEPTGVLKKPEITVCKYTAQANLIGAVHTFLDSYSE